MCSRDNEALINHYSGGIKGLVRLNDEQYDAVRVAMALAFREIDDRYNVAYAKQADQIADLNNEVVRVKKAWKEAEEEVAALLDELQPVREAKVVKGAIAAGAPVPATISHNGNGAAVAEKVADPTPAPDPEQATTGERQPAALRYPTLDDKSLEIVRGLDEGRLTWRMVDRADRHVITLATIAELQNMQPVGRVLERADFDRLRPSWLSGAMTLCQTLGKTWTQLHAAAMKP